MADDRRQPYQKCIPRQQELKRAIRVCPGKKGLNTKIHLTVDTNDILSYALSARMKPIIPPKKNRKEQRDYDK